ncbi:MAG: hypothetical protein A2W52_01360 [Candidatus Taylorbacteria bacterium RIFCSPHIGHO2_02_49_25]|uniref:Uncharacterized protein n=1 Tax=Candidatus Taylorbacteria bacterium RIFCSPHIGHO2_02_49_25 TaxID=1802305 RepID=A0A1G2MBJ1_9BACT|nr:MAG: hypothetical protein UY62_C0049G0009 [Parcubacteria group bacterium GW2011_GWF2_50_9]OHA21218.1 MAG: hypothetical protein A2W52_01360 [Candidatus Taylorbacteria bacterium RIFCSPHIGHO2_02_49_25]OHA21442.1 MAG: hypothetical protein A2759_03500 [Candidatus Taylorbacteria bacterium RIFCSPHIGHO2_01_FULL_49_60]OHA35338.1 MAG: hypothetical protein A2W65_02465 [Candidatus Taylorbacteria bacterium RIFCSPLOWO2_02_50_13]OHA36922.1 MAG: hypothetical protein A3B27_01390 [Candidatus Taylorbacteria ba
MKKRISFEKLIHKMIFDRARGKQKKKLLALLNRGYKIERANGFEGIEIRRGRVWRCITVSGRDLSPSQF